jgi:hypothetical protein
MRRGQDECNPVSLLQSLQIGENKNVLNAVDFVSSEGAEEGLLYPMHIMVRDANGSVAYGYLDDIDAQPELQIVHVDEGA